MRAQRRASAAMGVLMGVAMNVATARAQDKTVGGVRTTVPMSSLAACRSSPSSVDEIGKAYYTLGGDEFVRKLGDVLTACRLLTGQSEYIVVLFTAAPTEGADSPSVIHVLLHASAQKIEEVGGLAGVASASWVYLTDKADDEVRIQLFSTANENPLIKQIGPLAEAILGAVFKIAEEKPPPRQPTKTIHTSLARSVGLPFKRASISESDFVMRLVKKDANSKAEPKQIEGQFAFQNLPKSWLTFHAGVGVLTGSFHGVHPAKIDNDAYVSNPLKRAATVVGAAVHKSFDSSSPEPTTAERLGFVVGATLTPAAGIYIGPSYGRRGFSLTAGVAWLWTQTTPLNFRIGDALKKAADGGPEEQLVYGRVHAWMIGWTYAFAK